SSCDEMKIRPWIFLIPLALGLFTAPRLAGQTSEDAPATLRADALQLLMEGHFEGARSSWAAIAASVSPSSFDRLEASFYAEYAGLAFDLAQAGFGQWESIPEDPWRGRRRELERRAGGLRQTAPV